MGDDKALEHAPQLQADGNGLYCVSEDTMFALFSDQGRPLFNYLTKFKIWPSMYLVLCILRIC